MGSRTTGGPKNALVFSVGRRKSLLRQQVATFFWRVFEHEMRARSPNTACVELGQPADCRKGFWAEALRVDRIVGGLTQLQVDVRLIDAALRGD